MINELEQILSAAGDAGAVIVLVISAVLIVWIVMSSLVKIANLWRDAAKERNGIDAKRNEIDEKVADTLVSVSDTLERLQVKTDDTQTLVTGLRREQQAHNADATERHEALITALEPLPRIETAVTDIQQTWVQDFKRIGATLAELKTANEAHGTKLEALFKEWQTTGSRLLIALEKNEHQEPGESTDSPKPETYDNHTPKENLNARPEL